MTHKQIEKDFQQRKKVKYFKTFAAIIKVSTNKTLFTILANKKLDFYQLDIITIFLNSYLDMDVYIKQLEIFYNANNNKIINLYKSVYKLK